MAESKSTIITASGTSSPCRLHWTSLASDANNTYVDVNNVDASKVVFIIGNNKATGVTATCGIFYVGTSGSAASGSTFAYPFSAADQMRMKIDSTRDGDTDAAFPSTGGKAQFTVLGPFETARFKSSDGYIKICKAKSAGDAGDYYIAPLFIK